jgi:hypothetical protein
VFALPPPVRISVGSKLRPKVENCREPASAAARPRSLVDVIAWIAINEAVLIEANHRDWTIEWSMHN